MTRDFGPTNSTEAKNETLKTKREPQNIPMPIPKAQQDRINALAKKQVARAEALAPPTQPGRGKVYFWGLASRDRCGLPKTRFHNSEV